MAVLMNEDVPWVPLKINCFFLSDDDDDDDDDDDKNLISFLV